MDECASGDEAVKSVVGPTTTDLGSVVIAVSSSKPGSVFNSFVGAINPVTNQPVLHSIVLGQPCEACVDSATPHLCVHNEVSTSLRKDVEQQRRIAELYDLCGFGDVTMKEMFSTLYETKRSAFGKHDIDRAFISPLQHCDTYAEFVTIGIDTANGGRCEFSLMGVIGVMIAGALKYQLIAISSELINKDEQNVNDLIRNFLVCVMRHPRVRCNTPFLIALEAMSADQIYVAPRIVNIGKELGLGPSQLHVLCEKKCGDTYSMGTPKTEEVTEHMVTMMNSMLRTGQFSLVDDLVVSSASANNIQTADDQLKKLRDQYYTYQYDKNGKIHGKFNGKNDDALVALLTAIYWIPQFCTSTRNYDVVFRSSFRNMANTWRCGALSHFVTDKIVSTHRHVI